MNPTLSKTLTEGLLCVAIKARPTRAGEGAELTLFSGPHGYFLPYVDSQAGNETYGAGRYLEPEKLPDGKFLVDFNLGYNPYCAYNELYSCPLPPGENRVNVPIRAGEKSFSVVGV